MRVKLFNFSKVSLVINIVLSKRYYKKNGTADFTSNIFLKISIYSDANFNSLAFNIK